MRARKLCALLLLTFSFALASCGYAPGTAENTVSGIPSSAAEFMADRLESLAEAIRPASVPPFEESELYEQITGILANTFENFFYIAEYNEEAQELVVYVSAAPKLTSEGLIANRDNAQLIALWNQVIDIFKQLSSSIRILLNTSDYDYVKFSVVLVDKLSIESNYSTYDILCRVTDGETVQDVLNGIYPASN